MLTPPDWNLLALATTAACAASFTPGPNNAICLALGASFGVRRAMPFALGVAVGFPAMFAFIGAGLGGVLAAYPSLHLIIKIGGGIFLLHMAWKIATSRSMGDGGGRMLGFRWAVMFQWLNPKGLAFAFSLAAAYTRPQFLLSDIVYLMIITAVVALASTSVWAIFGAGLGRLLKSPRALAIFNGVMGALLALSALPIFLL